MKSICKGLSGEKASNVITIKYYREKLQPCGKKKRMRGEDWAPFFMQHFLLFTTLCNPVWFAVVYVKNAFAECPCDADGNTIRREPDSASLFESNNQTLPTLQQAEQQRIMKNTGELTMTKAPVRLRNLQPGHSAISP